MEVFPWKGLGQCQQNSVWRKTFGGVVVGEGGESALAPSGEKSGMRLNAQDSPHNEGSSVSECHQSEAEKP